MIVDHCPALDNLSLTIYPFKAYQYVTYVISICIVFLQYRKKESNNLNVCWPRVAPSCPNPVLGLSKTWS